MGLQGYRRVYRGYTRCATLADCRLQTGRLYIVLPIRIYAIYTYTSIYTYTYIPIPIRSASLANRSSSLANPSASLQVCSLQVSHTGLYKGIQGVYTLQGITVTGEYRRIQRNTREYRGIQENIREYKGIQENTRGYRRIH